jgi:hypothetical protein
MIMKSPIGRIITAAVLVVALSPKARELARKYAVAATERILDITDRIKETSANMKLEPKLENETKAAQDELTKRPLETLNTET